MRCLEKEYPVATVCQVLGWPRSTYYYTSQARDDGPLQAALAAVVEEWPTYGYRRVSKELQRRGWLVNSKRVRRVLREMGLQRPRAAQRKRTTDSRHGFPRFPNLLPGLAITAPDQVWVADLTYIRLRREFVFLAVLMDVFTRGIRGWHLSRFLDQELSLTALRRALEQRTPQIHHSDQGVQYAVPAYVQMLQEAGVQVSMAPVGDPRQNGYAERLIRTLKEEEVNLSDYVDYADAYRQIGRFLEEVYMHKRIHSSLGYQTPVEFESQWQSQLAGAKEG